MSIHLTLRALRLHTTTLCTALQQQVAKARQEHLLLWPPISRVKSFSKKNNTVVITKLLTDKTSKDLVLLIEWKISMRDYDHNYSECYFFHIRFNLLHQRDLPVSLYPAYLSGYETWLPFLLLLPIALLHWSDDTNKICKVEKISGNHLGGGINPRDVTAVTFISLVFESIG